MRPALLCLAVLLLLPLSATAQNASYRVLLPVYFEEPVPGAFGSQWKTVMAVHNPTAREFVISWCPANPLAVCPAVLPALAQLSPGETQTELPDFAQAELNLHGGPRLLYIRGTGPGTETPSQLSFQLRALDVSRLETNAGTEVPVVRQEQFRTATTSLLNVPVEPNFRLTLRIYETKLPRADFRVRVYDQLSNFPLGNNVISVAYRFNAGDLEMFEPPHAQLGDITSLVLPIVNLPPRLRVQIEPLTPGSEFWGFVSITNNDTQHLTLVTPQ